MPILAAPKRAESHIVIYSVILVIYCVRTHIKYCHLLTHINKSHE